MVYPNYFLWYNHLPSLIPLNHDPFIFLFHLWIMNLRLGPRSSITSASSSRIFPPLFFLSFCRQTSIFSPSASSPHIFLHNFSFLSTILHLLFSFLPQPTSYSPLFYYCSISWTFLSLSYFPMNTWDVFLTEDHFFESTLLAFKLQASHSCFCIFSLRIYPLLFSHVFLLVSSDC